MKKVTVTLLLIVLAAGCGLWSYGMILISREVQVFATVNASEAGDSEAETNLDTSAEPSSGLELTPGPKPSPVPTPSAEPPDIYEVYVEGELQKRFPEYEAAVAYAADYKESAIKEKDNAKWLWDNFMPYNVFIGVEDYKGFNTFAEAVAYAKEHRSAHIYYRKNNALVWTNAEEPRKSASIDAPVILQLPELPRGCEVTSLAMLLSHRGVDVSKMTLAEQIKKVPFSYTSGGKRLNGNPYDGFVGSMYDFGDDGLGVYHGPIYELLKRYVPSSAHDLTGCDFEDLYYFLDNGAPVWIITNSTQNKLPASEFSTWQTSSGELDITYREHSVLITGYDGQYIYYNDPYNDQIQKTEIGSFAEAWEQMGRQAVVCMP